MISEIRRSGYWRKVAAEVLRALDYSTESFLEREKSQSAEKGLVFDVAHYPVFQNISNVLQELHFLLTLDKEHPESFPDKPIVGFCNDKGRKL